ncbi:GNAT family N-acetyltransferase [Psychrobacillus sp. FSL K6-2684]|uniref:GNAT family N-acetyltransferase n=1 Tax=Psychrobacillus faecigallinarum TaxID=2762235 RepID=A0ABR8RB27_9BACI|nr:GNAT family N-acetyltransferase [Psychrobacillus faecigallinarum]MBD7945001.1 GNAT family N-acetyltransferase [Psychrobacillus faecigallinarum]
MILLLDHHNQSVAEEMLEVQLPAYRKEVEIIGFDGIPQLKETTEDIKASKEIYIGKYEKEQLLGFISYEINGDEMDICRLVVHPNHFRKGIASELLKYVLDLAPNSVSVIVSTGAKNKPALTLYERHNFSKIKDIEVEPNFFITQLKYNSQI